MISILFTTFVVPGRRPRAVAVSREYGNDVPPGRPFKVSVTGSPLTPEEAREVGLPGPEGEVYYRTSRIALIRGRVFAARLAVAGA